VLIGAIAPSLTAPVVFRWYGSDTSTTPLYTGTPFATPASTVDTTYYVTVSGGNYCENLGDRKPVNVVISCVTVKGTLYPFFYDPGYPGADTFFRYTVSLYDAPTSGTGYEQYDEIMGLTPRYTSIAEYYDGTDFITGIPKKPGNVGQFNLAGLPIAWNRMGRPTNLADTSMIHTPGVLPEYPVGIYTLGDVEKGTYILRISRAGFVDRFAKITISDDGSLGHRFLVPGDVDGDGQITPLDRSLITANYAISSRDPRYRSRYDLDASLSVDGYDRTICQIYIGFTLRFYQETMDWLNE